MRRSLLSRALGVVLTLVLVLPSTPSAAQKENGGSAPVKTHGGRTWVPHAPRHDVFGAKSQWRLVVRHAQVADDSAALVKNLASQVADNWGGTAAFNVHQYAVSAYTVTAGTKRHRVIYDNCQAKPYLPPQLYDRTRGAAFRGVPIPRHAVASPGSDSELSLYDRSTDQLWELWQAHRERDGWHACWGGRIDDVSRSPGYYADGMGVSATGLSSLGGAVRVTEARRGRITHAMSLNVIQAAHWSDFSFPAQRSDGAEPAGTAHAIEEGRRFKLDPSVRVADLHLSPLGAMIARAAKRYGFIVNDKGGAVAVIAESGVAMTAAGHGDPWSSLLGADPDYAIMRGFPWDRLQALPKNYGRALGDVLVRDRRQRQSSSAE